MDIEQVEVEGSRGTSYYDWARAHKVRMAVAAAYVVFWSWVVFACTRFLQEAGPADEEKIFLSIMALLLSACGLGFAVRVARRENEFEIPDLIVSGTIGLILPVSLEQPQAEDTEEASSYSPTWKRKARMAFAIACGVFWSWLAFDLIRPLLEGQFPFRAVLTEGLDAVDGETWHRVRFVFFGFLFSVCGIASAVRFPRASKFGFFELLALGFLAVAILARILTTVGII